MMLVPKLLRMNLQTFAGDIDLNAFRQEFEQEFQEIEHEQPELTEQLEDTEQPEVEPVEETDTDPLEQDVETEDVQADDESEVEPEPEQPKKQTREENAAFAEMRRQNEALQKQASLVEKAAAKHGMTVDQYLAAVEEAELEERATKQGIPAEFLRRQEQMERQLEEMTVRSAQSTYYSEVATVKSKYNMTSDEEAAVFSYIGERGLFDPKTRTPIIPFEDAYKLANFDKVQERRIREAKQQDLAAKKQRQQRTAVAHTNASSVPNTTVEDEITDEFVQNRLKSRNLI